MNEFELFSPDNEDVCFNQVVPSTLQPQCLRGGTHFSAACSFGNMVFGKFAGEGFEIWKSVYLIERDARVIGRVDRPLLELGTMFDGALDMDWKGIFKGQIKPKQMDLYYVPYADNLVHFKGNRIIVTVDIHYSPELLVSYAEHFPVLADFLKRVGQKQAARLFEGRQFLSPYLNSVIQHLINYSLIDELASRYYDAFAHQILIHLLEAVKAFSEQSRKIASGDIERAHEARRLLTMERINEKGRAYTIYSLSRLLGTNPFTLKKTFKAVFGTSIGRFKKDVFMQHAAVLLQQANVTIDDVAIQLGYSTQQDFGTAFKTYFGITPGVYRKNHR